MKRLISTFIAIAVLISIAVPVSVSAATAKPTELKQAKAGENSVDFSWSPVFGKDVKYEIQMGNTNEDFTTVRGTDDWYSDETHYEASNLVPGKTYYARVRAFADNAYSDWSDAIELVTVPKAVTGFV